MVRSLAAFALLLSAPAFAAERGYSVSDFDEVRVVGGHAVAIGISRSTTVKASGTAQALDTLSIEVQGRTLVIQSRAQTMLGTNVADRGVATVTIMLPALRTVRLQGNGSVAATLMRGAQADVVLSGGGSIAIARIDADRATLRLGGAGRIEAAGKAKDLVVDVRGAGELVVDKLIASDLKLTSATSGRATLTATRSANLSANGPGEIVVRGKPSCSVQNNGTGRVSCGE